MLVLLGVLVVVVGFALRLNAMLVVTVAGLVTGFLGGLSAASDQIRSHPSAFNSSSCRAKFWSLVDTRAYPYSAIRLPFNI